MINLIDTIQAVMVPPRQLLNARADTRLIVQSAGKESCVIQDFFLKDDKHLATRPPQREQLSGA